MPTGTYTPAQVMGHDITCCPVASIFSLPGNAFSFPLARLRYPMGDRPPITYIPAAALRFGAIRVYAGLQPNERFAQRFIIIYINIGAKFKIEKP